MARTDHPLDDHDQRENYDHVLQRASLFGGMLRLKRSDGHSKVSMLPRCLTYVHLVPLGIGATIGAGVYVLIGTAAREEAGPALPFSYLIAGTAAGLAALCYAELASRCPSAGSAYHYAYLTVGEIVAWIIGWSLILEYTVGGAAVARGISPNITEAFGSDSLPSWLARFTITNTSIVIDPCAGLWTAVVTLLLCFGVKESASFQAGMTLLNVIVLGAVVVIGLFVGFANGWPGYHATGGYLPFGVNGVLGGAAMVFYSYIGFDAVASTAEEVKKPQRDLPMGIGLSLVICGGLYMAVAAILVGLVPYYDLDEDTPLAQAFDQYGVTWAKYLVSGGALSALSTTLLGSLLPQPRILMAMARDGLLPRFFCKLNPKRIPVYSTLLTGCMAAALAVTMDITTLSGMVSVGTLLAFTVVSLSVLILRYVPPTKKPVKPVSQGVAKHIKDKIVLQHSVNIPQPIMRQALMRPEPSPSFVQSIKETEAHRFLPIVFPELQGMEADVMPSPSPSVSSFSSLFLSRASLPELQKAEEKEEQRLISDGEEQYGEDGEEEKVRFEIGEEEGEEEEEFEKKNESLSYGSFLKADASSPPSAPLLELSSSSSPPVSKFESEESYLKRRKLAAFAIFSICFSVPILALSASLTILPSWFLWTMAAISFPFFLIGSFLLFRLEEDDGRHSFGHSGAFQCPWVPLLPIASILINVYLLVNLGSSTWIRCSIWILLGIFVYFGFGIRHSMLGIYEAERIALLAAKEAILDQKDHNYSDKINNYNSLPPLHPEKGGASKPKPIPKLY